MKTINLFLASSSELAPECNVLSYLAVLLDDVFARRGLLLRIQKWEHMDASLNKARKQTEYNYHIHESELVFVLFWNKFGKYTQEEYDEAIKVSEEPPHGVPHISIFFKGGGAPEEKLVNFKREITDSHPEILHSFSNDDELIVLFLLELNRHLAEKHHKPFLRIEDECLYADDIRLCPIPTFMDCSFPNGENLDSIVPAYDGPQPINMLLACTSDQLPLRNDFCDLVLAWNQILAARGLRLCVKFFDKDHIDNIENMSELASVFYWRDFGSFDKTAFDYTYQRIIQADMNPQKFFTFFRHEDAQLLAKEFREFKEHLSDDDEYSHFYIGFDNPDELRYKFLQQFELYLIDTHRIQNFGLEAQDGFIREKSSHTPLVKLNELPAFRNSKEYQNVLTDLRKQKNLIDNCDEKIRKLRIKGSLKPDAEEKLNQLETQRIILGNSYKQKREQADELEKVFLETSLLMARIMQDVRNQELKRADALLGEGLIKECKNLLDTIIGDVDDFVKAHHENQKVWHDTAHTKLKALLIKVNADSRDFSIDGKERHAIVRNDYEKALRFAQGIHLPDNELFELVLLPYSDWLAKENDFIRGLEIARLAEQACRRLADSQPDVFLPYLATSLNNLGVLQNDCKCYDDAIKSHTEAISLRRKLADAKPDVFLPDLASSLLNLGNIQCERKHYEEAEKSYMMVASIYSKLLKIKQEVYRYRPLLAKLLNNFGTLLLHIQRYDESAKLYREAISIYRRLDEVQPEVFLQDLAMSLNNLATLEYVRKNYKKAEVAYKEAISIYQKLANTQPNAFIPTLAQILNNFGNLKNECKHYKVAENLFKKSIDIYRRLINGLHNVIFLSNLAIYLNNLGNFLLNFHRNNESEALFKESIAIQREIADLQPGMYLHTLAASLKAFGKYQRDIKHYDEAYISFKESVSIYRKLAELQPDPFMLDLATSLNDLGSFQRIYRYYNDASKSFIEAIEILRKLTTAYPDQILIYLAGTLNNYGNFQRDCKLYKEAEKSYNEAIEINRKLALKQPNKFSLSLATLLNNLGAFQRDCKQYKKADKSYKEAISILQEQLGSHHEAIFIFATSLYNLAMLQEDCKFFSDAEKTYNEVIKIYYKLAPLRPDNILPTLASSLDSLGTIQINCKRYEDALKTYKESIKIYRKIALMQPDIPLPDLAIKLNKLGRLQVDCNCYDEAEISYNEALEICRKLANIQPEDFLWDLKQTLNNIKDLYEKIGDNKKLQETMNEIGIINNK